MPRILSELSKSHNISVNVLFPALTPAYESITFVASTLKQKSYFA